MSPLPVPFARPSGGRDGASAAPNPAHVHASVRIHHCRAEWRGKGQPLSGAAFFVPLCALLRPFRDFKGSFAQFLLSPALGAEEQESSGGGGRARGGGLYFFPSEAYLLEGKNLEGVYQRERDE